MSIFVQKAKEKLEYHKNAWHVKIGDEKGSVFKIEIKTAQPWNFDYRQIDLLCHRALKDVCGQSPGSLRDEFCKMLVYDWPKPTYAARWYTRSMSR